MYEGAAHFDGDNGGDMSGSPPHSGAAKLGINVRYSLHKIHRLFCVLFLFISWWEDRERRVNL